MCWSSRPGTPSSRSPRPATPPTEALRAGARDYLFRDELDGRLLSRAIRYAVERKRSDTAERRLAEGRMRAQENRRLERGLLPTPLLEGSSLRFAARYRPGRSRACSAATSTTPSAPRTARSTR
ncbi:hypothetical protein SALBM311S_11661 [Streptomyces alboniger]